jgi:predicted ester cyclase
MSSDVTTDASQVASRAPGRDDLGGSSRQLLEQAFNDGNLALVDQLVAPDAVSHDPATPPELRGLSGLEVFKTTVTMYRAAFPDVRMIVDDVIAADDKVVLRWHSEGTHRGQLAGLAPTGVHGLVTGITINRWKDGKVVESWVEWDNLGLARQIGAAPPEGSVGEKIGVGLQRLTARRLRQKHTG